VQLVSGGTPGPGCAERSVDHHVGDGVDEHGLLELRDEAAGLHQAALGMVPAEQGLRPGDVPGRQVELGLVPDLELAALDRGRNGTEQREVVPARAIVGGVVDRDRRSFHRGPVHRDARPLQQLVTGMTVLGEDRDTDAGLDVDRYAVDDVRLPDLRLEPSAGERQGPDLVHDRRQPIRLDQRRERAFRDHASGPIDHGGEDAPAEGGSEGVLDLEEVVELRDRDDELLVGLGRCEQAIQSLQQTCRVQQPLS
jgi:hypothetical protein